MIRISKNIIEDIYNFFLIDENHKGCSLSDFIIKQHKESIDKGDIPYYESLQISRICDLMCKDMLLYRVKKDEFFIHDTLFSIPQQDIDNLRRKFKYGTYYYKYMGFSAIHRDFYRSVVPIEGHKKDGSGDLDVGTAFYIGYNRFVTAKHCVTDLEDFRLLSFDGVPYNIIDVLFPHESESKKDNDIAILIIDEKSLDLPRFRFDDPKVLDEVLVIGFPKIPGLDLTQTVEKASVNTYLNYSPNSSLGNIVGINDSYLTKMQYFLVNARVKGGNSGGPVINEYGYVIGFVVKLPFDMEKANNDNMPPAYDIMGYGICQSSDDVIYTISNHDIYRINKKNNGYYEIGDFRKSELNV